MCPSVVNSVPKNIQISSNKGKSFQLVFQRATMQVKTTNLCSLRKGYGSILGMCTTVFKVNNELESR